MISKVTFKAYKAVLMTQNGALRGFLNAVVPEGEFLFGFNCGFTDAEQDLRRCKSWTSYKDLVLDGFDRFKRSF